MDTTQHRHYMSLALQLAEKGRFSVSPNPCVGCVIVKNNSVVAQGFHQRAGGAHAEIIALQAAGVEANGATAYVTLEPCCHQGKTPPCTNALIAAGIKKIYVACVDPNPQINGAGIAALRLGGIEVEVGLCATEALQLNEIFFHFIKTKRPFVIAKWAMSLDGKTQVNAGDHRQISCAESQRHTHELRQSVDAILVGANTAMLDNPQLTARSDQPIHKQPIRIVLAGCDPFPEDLKIFNDGHSSKTFVATTHSMPPEEPSLPVHPEGSSLPVRPEERFARLEGLVTPSKRAPFETALRASSGRTDRDDLLVKQAVRNNIEAIVLPKDEFNQVSLPALLDELGKRNITSLLVEGGMRTHESFFRENLIDKIHVYLSPFFIGSSIKQPLNILEFSPKGKDLHLIANLKEAPHV